MEKAKVSYFNLFKGIAFILVGMAVSYVIWNILLGTDVIYLSSKRVGASQLIPLLSCLPGIFIFLIWFFKRKGDGENKQLLTDDLYKYAAFLVIAIGLDIAGGLIGVFLTGLKYIGAAIIAWIISLILQIAACWLAFQFGNPYKS